MTDTGRASPAETSIRQRKKSRKRKSGFRRQAISTKDAQSMARGLPRDEAVALFDKQISTFSAARALALEPALESTVEHVGPSPSVAAGKAAAQQLLGQLNEDPETRLLTATDMAAYAHKHRNWPAEAARRKNLIGLDHAGRTLYPAFQIDPTTRRVRRWVPTMAKALDEIGIDGRAFVLWTATPSESFQGERPADHTGDEDFLPRAASELADT